MKIPDDPKYGDHTIAMHLKTTNQYFKTTASAKIVVADPRPPTVKMSMRPANDELVVAKQGSVNIEVHTSTYAGTVRVCPSHKIYSDADCPKSCRTNIKIVKKITIARHHNCNHDRSLRRGR